MKKKDLEFFSEMKKIAFKDLIRVKITSKFLQQNWREDFSCTNDFLFSRSNKIKIPFKDRANDWTNKRNNTATLTCTWR